ncbi:hypothetical protein EDD18DRAFT_1188022 [Armillaria luteobubalina]|uniref:DUF6534 domain-containing protein n=1 Tax=Armillaria luteobubalina TaxID=153913 RepID=A0AA39TI54_9AGAR|nr:hypothetical protein EDD18DRAFT_1188022 [Armillaria luteobubalina]
MSCIQYEIPIIGLTFKWPKLHSTIVLEHTSLASLCLHACLVSPALKPGIILLATLTVWSLRHGLPLYGRCSSLPTKYRTLTAGLHRILEVLHVAFPGHAIYYYVILHYGDPTALTKATWTASATLGVTGLTGVLVYLFYARRIYYLSNHNVPLVAVIIFLSVCRLGTSLGLTGFSIHLKYFVQFERHSVTSLVRASLAIHVVTDFLVAGSLCYYLHSSRTGVKRTDTLINRLMVYAIHNGLITAVADILVMAFNIAYPGNLVYLAVYQIVANLYSNSLLATLNARRPSKQVNNNFTSEVDMLSLSTFGNGRTTAINNPNTRVDINITSDVDTMRDIERNPSTSNISKVVSL